jgi:1,5-anhydro-D-fructose reductase (1,5-anhydro-D-mannitol-forming)
VPPPMPEKVRMAFVGLGHWSDMLAEAAQASGKIAITACLSRSADKKETFVKNFGGAAKDTFDSLIGDPAIDAIVLTTPNSVHAEQCIAAAVQGKHIFIEKPMALTVADCRRMIAATDKASVVLAIGQNKRRMPMFRKVHAMIAAGALGTIILAEANSSSGFGLTATPDKWRWYRNESPGGALTSHTVHHADLFNHLIGVPKRVTGFARKVCGAMEADDVVNACLEFSSGALGYLGGSYLSPTRKYVNLFGTEGLIFVDEDTGSLSYKKKGASDYELVGTWAPAMQTRSSLQEELDEFAACIQTGTRPEVGGREGMQAVAVIEAIMRASDSGSALALDSLLL